MSDATTTTTNTTTNSQQLGDKRPREEEAVGVVSQSSSFGGSLKPKTFLIRHKKIRSDFALISWMLYDFRDALGIASWFESKVTLAKTHAVAQHQESGDVDVTASTTVPQTSEEIVAEGDDESAEGVVAPKVDTEVEHESIGVLKPKAPLQCVYVDFSRKPYFLVEWCCVQKREDGTEGLLQPPTDAAKLLEAKLLDLNGKEYKGEPIEVMVALPGATVAAQRAKVVAVHKAAVPIPPAGNSSNTVSSGVDKPVAPSTYVAPKKMVPRAMMRKK